MRRYDLVCFDVDGTLVEHPDGKTVWQILNSRFVGNDAVNEERFRAYRSARITYEEWVDLDIGDWRRAGARRERIVRSIEQELRLVPGAREALGALGQAGCRLAVISGTLDIVLEVLFPEHPFDEVYANRIRFDAGGAIEGWEATPFDMAGKALALRGIAEREAIPLGRCAFVGDHDNDLEAAREAGLAIAFNPKSRALEEVCGAVVRAGDLRAILPWLLEPSPGPSAGSAGEAEAGALRAPEKERS